MKKVRAKRNFIWMEKGMEGIITDTKWEDDTKLYLIEFEEVGKRIWLTRDEFEAL